MNKQKTRSSRIFCCACLQLGKSLAERGFRPQAHVYNINLINFCQVDKTLKSKTSLRLEKFFNWRGVCNVIRTRID